MVKAIIAIMITAKIKNDYKNVMNFQAQLALFCNLDVSKMLNIIKTFVMLKQQQALSLIFFGAQIEKEKINHYQ